MEFEKAIKQWVKIVHVKDIDNEISAITQGGGSAKLASYTNWLATIQFSDGRTTKVSVVISPKPQVGQCLPVFSSEASNGMIVAKLDDQQWRYGTEFDTCQ